MQIKLFTVGLGKLTFRQQKPQIFSLFFSIYRTLANESKAAGSGEKKGSVPRGRECGEKDMKKAEAVPFVVPLVVLMFLSHLRVCVCVRVSLVVC